MRYADHPTAETEVFVAAPPGRIWPLVTEIMTPARFGTELQEATWLDVGAGPGVEVRRLEAKALPAR